MTTLAEAFREEVEAKIGHSHTLLMPNREPRWSDVEEEFPTNASLARAAGFGAAEDNRRGSKAWNDRRNFMRSAQRWRAGTKQHNPFGKSKWSPRLTSIVERRWRRQATPRSWREVLSLMSSHGITMTAIECTFAYEKTRERTIHATVSIAPWALEEANFTEAIEGRMNWRQAAQAVINAWAAGYGMGELPYDEGGVFDVEMSFRLGRDPNARWSTT